MYISYFLQISKSSPLMCASLNQTAKLGLLDPWSWTDSCSETSVTTHLCCITSQKSKELISTMAEAWYHAHYYQFFSLVKWLAHLTSVNG